jgi:hypothetical protein
VALVPVVSVAPPVGEVVALAFALVDELFDELPQAASPIQASRRARAATMAVVEVGRLMLLM